MRNRIGAHIKDTLNESGENLYGLFKDVPYHDKASISGISMIPTNANQCRVYFHGGSVFSAAKFRRGDIIEICPTRTVRPDSLYSREIRDMVFDVSPSDTEHDYVIPMGYCQNYDITGRAHPEPNCEYEWRPSDRTVVIRALCGIPSDTLLVLDIEQ